MVTRMSGGYAGASGGGGPGSSPPDLPSLLLDARICYIGMPVGAAAVCVAALCKEHLQAPVPLCSCLRPAVCWHNTGHLLNP